MGPAHAKRVHSTVRLLRAALHGPPNQQGTVGPANHQMLMPRHVHHRPSEKKKKEEKEKKNLGPIMGPAPYQVEGTPLEPIVTQIKSSELSNAMDLLKVSCWVGLIGRFLFLASLI